MKSQLVRSDARDYGVCNKLSNRKKILCYFTLDFTFQRWWIHYIDRFQLWTCSQKILLDVFFFAPVVCACFYLYTAFGCHYREIYHAVLGKTSCVHCLSSCIVLSLGFLSGLSLCWNNTFTENSFYVVLSKSQRVKLLSKRKRRRHWNLPFSETISMVSLKQLQQYSSTTPHTLALYIQDWHSYAAFPFHLFSKPTNIPLEIAAFNHGFLTQSNSSLWKY